MSLTVGAIAAIVAGCKALLGHAGAALAALTMILVGNPFSGVATAPELLPRPAGGLGQLLPPGAGGNLLRSTGFFDGSAAGGHVVVLAAWLLAGLALLIAASSGVRIRASRAPAGPSRHNAERSGSRAVARAVAASPSSSRRHRGLASTACTSPIRRSAKPASQ